MNTEDKGSSSSTFSVKKAETSRRATYLEKVKDYSATAMIGIVMGAADIIPGVSGGTIAFISGRYERLIDALNSVSLRRIYQIREQGLSAAWSSMDGTFLLVLFSGVLLSLLSLSSIVLSAMQTYPIPLRGFFFGLIFCSGLLMFKHIKTHTLKLWLLGLFGAALSFGINLLTPKDIVVSHGSLFLGGVIAICAMILPGVSGSFLLLLMGLYSGLLMALNTLSWSLLMSFAAGAILGLLSFVRLLKFLLSRYHDVMMAFLIGIMLGALTKVWPWKYNQESTLVIEKTSEFDIVNLSPTSYEVVTGQPAELGAVVMAFSGAMAIVLFIEWVSRRKNATA